MRYHASKEITRKEGQKHERFASCGTRIMREMRQAMQTKNISLTLLADMSGVPLETVERLESGRLDVKLDEAMRVLGKLELTLKVVPL